MTAYIYAGYLVVSFVLYKIVSSILSNRYHARKAEELGCKPPLRRKHRLPFGADLAWAMIQADKANIIPEFFIGIQRDLGVATWDQVFLGSLSIVTTDPKNIQALLATQFNDFEIGSLRRSNFFPLLGNGIFTSDGKSWEHSRAMLRPQFARQQVSDLELEEVHVQDLFRHLPTDFSSNDGWTSRVDLAPIFFRLTLDSATEFLFGKSVDSQIAALPNGQRQVENTGPTLDWTAFGPAFDGATMALGIRGRLAELYWVYNPLSFRRQCKSVHEFADYYVNLALNTDLSNMQQQNLEKGEKKSRYIFLQELVKATRDPVELRSQLLNILLAGRDTTAGLLGWTFYCLARDEERFKKLRQAILADFGPYSDDASNITFEGLKSCTYLQHTLSEVLRIYPSVPLNTRRSKKDTTLPRGGGSDGMSPLYVPKGMDVNYPVHLMHHRKDIWGEDADDFKPERWVGRKPGWEFLPFNGGPRICLGQQFALTEAGFVIVRMLQRYDRIVPQDPDPVARHQYSVTTSPLNVLVMLHEASR